jgi:hypothetical protein
MGGACRPDEGKEKNEVAGALAGVGRYCCCCCCCYLLLRRVCAGVEARECHRAHLHSSVLLTSRTLSRVLTRAVLGVGRGSIAGTPILSFSPLDTAPHSTAQLICRTLTVVLHVMGSSGTLSGMAEETAGYPLDLVKVRTHARNTPLLFLLIALTSSSTTSTTDAHASPRRSPHRRHGHPYAVSPP